jgi:hypothetical protein
VRKERQEQLRQGRSTLADFVGIREPLHLEDYARGSVWHSRPEIDGGWDFLDILPSH